jgi:Icc-related predicted phosphoesterase
MHRFLICSGVHGDNRSLVRLRREVRKRRPDGILFAGGILHPSREFATRMTPWSLTRGDAFFMERFFRTLGSLQTFSAVIPGMGREPLEEFFRLGMQAELEYPDVHIVHATLVEEGHVAFSGIGGAIVERELLGTDSYSRVVTEYFLRALRRSKEPRRVLLLPAAPLGNLGGVEGDPLIGELIDSHHPSLCVVAGNTQRRGIMRIGNTLVVNPGYLSEGSAAWLDWHKTPELQVEFLDLGGKIPEVALAEE